MPVYPWFCASETTMVRTGIPTSAIRFRVRALDVYTQAIQMQFLHLVPPVLYESQLTAEEAELPIATIMVVSVRGTFRNETSELEGKRGPISTPQGPRYFLSIPSSVVVNQTLHFIPGVVEESYPRKQQLQSTVSSNLMTCCSLGCIFQ